ncbi:MAG: hypothetical protein RLZZ15_1684 [Verrucomicrobiota bacterium]|jgi:ribosomal protein L37AE/L43A
MFEFTTAAVLLCALVGGGLLALWSWYDRRDHRRFEAERRATAFCCTRCAAIYSARGGPALASCPKCGHENARLRF